MSERTTPSRTDFLKGIVVLPALAAAVASATTIAEAKSSKSALHYQDKPSGDKKCSGCSLFIPGKSATANGGCKVVAGSISPNGYCIAYQKK